MKNLDFFISWLVGTIIFIYGRTMGFSMVEIFIMWAMAGIVQGAVTGMIRAERSDK